MNSFNLMFNFKDIFYILMVNYIDPIIISLVYLLIRFIEMRFIIKQNIPLKELFRDTMLVCISCILGLFIGNQIKLPVNTKSVTEAFIGTPDF